MSELIQKTTTNNPVSVNKVDLLEGTYDGEMTGYSVTIIEGPITTRFRTNIAIRGTAICTVNIKNGFAEIILK